jgi:hypothetical protein
METVFYVGMDVRKESVQLAVLKNGQGRSELDSPMTFQRFPSSWAY